MGIPSSPTDVMICFEALRKSERMDFLPRALDQWLEEIKSDIWLKGAKLKNLHLTSIKNTSVGLSRYNLPSDFYSDMDITILFGDVTGTAQAGSLSTVTLAASETASEGDMVGREILITSGTGDRSMSKCTAYDEGTKVAAVTPDFQTAPVSGDGYMRIDQKTALISKPIWEKDKIMTPVKDIPQFYFSQGDESFGEFELFPTPDKIYGMQLRYYVNLEVLDLTGTRISTLYTNWRNIWMQGIYYRSITDPEISAKEERRYRAMIQELIAKETYENDLRGLQQIISDF